jgi:hypothetical protein
MPVADMMRELGHGEDELHRWKRVLSAEEMAERDAEEE